MHPSNKLTINAVEAAPLEDFSIEVNVVCNDSYSKTVVTDGYGTSRRSARTLPRPKKLLQAADRRRTSWRHRSRLVSMRLSNTLFRPSNGCKMSIH